MSNWVTRRNWDRSEREITAPRVRRFHITGESNWIFFWIFNNESENLCRLLQTCYLFWTDMGQYSTVDLVILPFLQILLNNLAMTR